MANPLRLLLKSECIPCFGAKTLRLILWQHDEIAKDALQGSLKLNEARRVDEQKLPLCSDIDMAENFCREYFQWKLKHCAVDGDLDTKLQIWLLDCL